MVSMILLLSVYAFNALTLIPSSNLGLIGVQIRRSETNLYKEHASTDVRYVSSIEFEGRGIGIGVQIGKHLCCTGDGGMSEPRITLIFADGL